MTLSEVLLAFILAFGFLLAYQIYDLAYSQIKKKVNSESPNKGLGACIIIVILLVFLLGWLFPVEGPFDFVYDNHAKRPAVHRPSKCCAAPLPKPKKTEIFEDFNEDGEPEWYQITPLFNVEEE